MAEKGAKKVVAITIKRERPAQDFLETFDWNSAKVRREYIKLEQKVMAGRATSEESGRYQAMKRDRNQVVFAERYLRDYAEVQRLRKLSEKLAEIQQFLCPNGLQKSGNHPL